jgi:hypothetical protein
MSAAVALVGVPGFEPGASRTRTVRSTGLSHTPDSRNIITTSPFFDKSFGIMKCLEFIQETAIRSTQYATRIPYCVF